MLVTDTSLAFVNLIYIFSSTLSTSLATFHFVIFFHFGIYLPVLFSEQVIELFPFPDHFIQRLIFLVAFFVLSFSA